MNELDPLSRSIAALLKERKETIAVAESSAGGLISAALLSVAGASA
jgi:nicotinamide-nucleotide amidase